MRSIFSTLTAMACVLGAAPGVFGADEWHDFKSATDGKTFTGRVVGYDPATKSVTVQRKGSTARVRFTIDKPGPEDQEYVAGVGKKVTPRTGKVGGVVRQLSTNEKNGRSKDTLEGCVVWIKVGGMIVKSVASSPLLLEKHGDPAVVGGNNARK